MPGTTCFSFTVSIRIKALDKELPIFLAEMNRIFDQYIKILYIYIINRSRNMIKEKEYKIVYYGNEALKMVAQDVMNIDDDILLLIDKMYNLMYKAQGIGLAAPQVDVSKRLVVLDTGNQDGRKMTLINPKIGEISDKEELYEEGCLSLPGISADIIRPSEMLVKGLDTDGKDVELEVDGLLARVLQHEIDHLNGILFIDHLENYQKKELRSYLKKIKKMN